MSDNSNRPNYKFGIELEMFLVFSREFQDIAQERTIKGKLKKAADHIARLYNDVVGVLRVPGDIRLPKMRRVDWDSDIVEDRSLDWRTSRYWNIQDDPSLYVFGIEQCPGWPLEFASPIFDYSIAMAPDYAIRGRYIPPWITCIQKLFEVLHDQTIISVNDDCALQISLSANNHYGWDSLDQVKSLAKSVLYFERGIRCFLPQSRRDNDYAKWNGSPTQVTSTTTRMNPQFQGTAGVGARIALVDVCATIEDLVMLMNNGHKRWSWNFTELEADPNSNLIHGRVEFRSPPGVNNGRACVAWIYFTLEFLHAAISTRATIHRLAEFESDWQGLAQFLDSVPPIVTRDGKVIYRRELGLPNH